MALSNKQQVFINEYLKCWNATEAARRAGYKKRQSGAENMSNPVIAEAIQSRLKALTMSADEALMRLSDQARGTMADFLDEYRDTIDLAKADDADKLHLIKKFTHHIGKETETITIELYDAQAAIVHILKEQHLKSGEPTEITDDASLTDENRVDRIAALLDAARARRDGQANRGDADLET